MPIKKFLLAGFVAASVIVFCIVAASSFYFYYIGIERKTEAIYAQNARLAQGFFLGWQEQTFSVMATVETPETADSADAAEAVRADHTSRGWLEGQFYETWTVTSGDGLSLVGYYIPAGISTTETVILAHGYGGSATEMSEFARFYSEKLGYNVLLPNARGHSASEGTYIGMGWPDRHDYLLWIQKIIDRVGNNAQIALHGLSMGGAAVMMVSGEELPSQVKVIVEDSGYTTVYDELAYQLKQAYNLPEFPFITATSLLTGIRAGFNFSEASALNQVEKNTTPMLFIHGVLDTVVPVDMALKLYDACKAEKQLYLAGDAGHGMAYYVNRPAYETVVSDFIARFIDSPPLIY